MAAKNFYGVTGTLTEAVDGVSTLLAVNAGLAGTLANGMMPGDYTFFSISAGNIYELVKVVSVYGNYLTVERGVETTAQTFPSGSKLAFQVTAEAITAQLALPPASTLVTGTGQADVTNPTPGEFNVDVPIPTIVGEGGVDVIGTWPSLTLALTPKDCCGGEAETGGSTGITSLQGEGIVQAYAIGAEGFVILPPPNFIGSGITITGTWPDYTFTVASGAGGTVLSVAAGPGLAITGSPTVSPVVNMSNTGVVAGTYGGIQINARGQIVAVPATLNPVSIVNFTAPINVTRLADAITISIATAGIGTLGAVALVDHTDPFDPLNTTEAMTPAAVKVALDTLGSADVTGANSYTGEADAAYVNTVGASATSIQLAAGQKAIIIATATVLNNTDPAVPHTWGLAVFNATPIKQKANKSIKQIAQSLIFMLEGPVSLTTLAIVTTDLTGATLVSYDLQILKL